MISYMPHDYFIIYVKSWRTNWGFSQDDLNMRFKSCLFLFWYFIFEWEKRTQQHPDMLNHIHPFVSCPLDFSLSLSLFPQTGTLCSSVSLEVCKSWALQPNISPLWSVRGPICSPPPPPPLLFLHVITPFSPDRGHKLAPFTLHFPQLHCF